MADEFAKGLGLATGAGLLWMVLAGWYRTPSFDGAQLTAPVKENLTAFDAIAVVVMEGLFWLTVLGMVTFWVLIPAGRRIWAQIDRE